MRITVVPEGKAEKHFIERLAIARGLEQVEIRSEPGGVTAFQTQLEALALDIREGNMDAIVLVGDNDEDPGAAFDTMKNQAESAEDVDLTLPGEPWEASSGRPTVSILTLPEVGVKGTLETLVWRAMASEYKSEAGLATAYITETPTGQASKLSTREKARFSALLAGTCLDDPSCMIHWMWQSDRGYQNLLLHSSFDPITNFLKAL